MYVHIHKWIIPYSAKFWRGKILANRSFQTFGDENVGELLIILLATLANLEFGWVKYWRMMYSSPNSPKFSPARILRYTVYCYCITVLNKNSLAVKKSARPIRSHNGYKRPKSLISSKAKKLNILLRILLLE